MIFNYINTVFRYFVYSNLLIATAAAAQMELTYLLLGAKANVNLVFVEASSTLLMYNLALFLSLPKDKTTTPYLRTKWVLSHPITFYTISIISLLLFLYHGFQLKPTTQLMLVCIGLFALLYLTPVFRIHGKRVNFRSIPLLKLFHISIIWVMSTVLLPVIDMAYSTEVLEFTRVVPFMLNRFLFLLICTLPFDIRDIKADTMYGLKTLPSLLGEVRSILFINILLCLHTFISMFLSVDWTFKVGFVITDLLVYYIINHRIQGSKDYLGVFLLDLVLVIQFLVLYIFHFIS